MTISTPRRPRQPEDDTGHVMDPRESGKFRWLYILIAVVVIISLIVGLLGPVIWRLI